MDIGSHVEEAASGMVSAVKKEWAGVRTGDKQQC